MWYGKYESLEDFDDMYVPPSSHVPPHEHPAPYPPFELPLREETFNEFVEGILSNPLEVNLVAQAEKEKIDAERAKRKPTDYKPKRVINSRHRLDPANWPIVIDNFGNKVSVHPSVVVAVEKANLEKGDKPPVIVSRGKWPGDLDTYLAFFQEFRTVQAGELPLEPVTELKPVEDMAKQPKPLGWVRNIFGWK